MKRIRVIDTIVIERIKHKRYKENIMIKSDKYRSYEGMFEILTCSNYSITFILEILCPFIAQDVSTYLVTFDL